MKLLSLFESLIVPFASNALHAAACTLTSHGMDTIGQHWQKQNAMENEQNDHAVQHGQCIHNESLLDEQRFMLDPSLLHAPLRNPLFSIIQNSSAFPSLG